MSGDQGTVCTPSHGYCLRTCSSTSGHVVYLNITHSKDVLKANKRKADEADAGASSGLHTTGEKGSGEEYWEVPYSIGQPQVCADNDGKSCTVYTIVFNTDTYDTSLKDAALKMVLHQTTFECITETYRDELDRHCQNHTEKFKNPSVAPDGGQVPSSDVKSPTPAPSTGVGKGDPVAPDYEMTVNENEILLEITLLGTTSARDVHLDISPTDMVATVPARYLLNVNFPQEVNDDLVSAKYDKKRQILKVTLPLAQK